MRVSRNWLNRYTAIRLDDPELAERLTMAGLEVEAVESSADALRGIVVGEIRSIEPHPNAAKLLICGVHDGTSVARVVSGAPNLVRGAKIAFAAPGSRVPRDQHDPGGGPLTIGRREVRGVQSEGMICSAYELSISDDRSGALLLPAAARPGTPIARELGAEDTIFEIGVTANRPDLLSHVGIAREIGAITGGRLKLPAHRVREGRTPLGSILSISVEDPVGCPRYAARAVQGVTVDESPGWLRQALLSVGVRPVNSVVDVTNYVLMEIGHPLHAFDHSKLGGSRIVVRSGPGGGRLETLDGKSREIADDTLLICDARGPVAIAGIMGGAESEISASTDTVVIESAYFLPASIRRTSKRLGLSTEASSRFERGADPRIVVWALDRAASMMAEICGGTVLKGRIDLHPGRKRGVTVSLDARKASELLGITLSNREVSGLLRKIGIASSGSVKGGAVRYSIPSWRPDITRPVDLVEEAARLHGYDRIIPSGQITLRPATSPPRPDIADAIRHHLSSAGFHEVVTNSMSDLETARHPGMEPVAIANPNSRDMAALRTTLLTGLLGVIRHNIFHGQHSTRFYEIGNVFGRDPSGDPESLSTYFEEERVCLTIQGRENPVYWGEKPGDATIFTLKGEANALLRKFSLDNPRYSPYSTPSALSDRSLHLDIQGQRVGSLGRVSRELRSRYEIEGDVYFLDLSLRSLRKIAVDDRVYRKYPRLPVVRRDIAVTVPEQVSAGELERVIRESAGPLLRKVELFDVYRGEQAGAGKKSCAFSLEFAPEERTMEQQEIQGLMDAVVGALRRELNAVPRQ